MKPIECSKHMKPRVQQTTDGGETAPVANKETLPVASKVNCYWLTRAI